MSKEDSDIWKHFIETHSVRKLDLNHNIVLSNNRSSSEKKHIRSDVDNNSFEFFIHSEKKNNYSCKLVDTSYFKKVQVQGKIDLHGMTQEKAYQNLTRFMNHSQLEFKKYVLVITGKGNISRTSVLKPLFYNWLTNHPHLVVAYAPAPPQWGGNGAFLVHIRRNRK